MAKIWEFFENMNAYVYVSDMDNHEMVYMNRKALELYGRASVDEVAGKKCYELLQGSNAPCAICTNAELRPGFFKEWEYTNPSIAQTLFLQDTMLVEDGRRLRLEIARDITQQVSQREALSGYQGLENLSNEGIRIALQAPTPDDSLNAILEYLGKALKSERTYIFEKNAHNNDDNTYEWTAAGVTPEKDNLQDVPTEMCADWYRQFHINESIFIRDIEDLRATDFPKYELLKSQNIHSLVVVPLYDGERVIGFYGVDNPPLEMLEYSSYMLQTTGHFIVSTLRRRNLVRQLREMSYHDQLTHFGNRYAMHAFTDSFDARQSLGVVYCDITGLKQVNDTRGHKAGDELILRSCACLKRVFGNYRLFRVGGDELLALCPGIEEAELMRRMELLDADTTAHDVVLAAGVVWCEHAGRDLDALFGEAERRMYANKAAYYHSTGLERRH